MQLQISFSVLLVAILATLSVQDAAAGPLKRRDAGMVSLPLRRVQQSRSDLHPHIMLQQHINRSQRRYARMTGREGPSDAELRSNMERRMYLLPNRVKPGSLPGKRFNTHGTKIPEISEFDLSNASISTKAKTTDTQNLASTENTGLSDAEIDALANGGTTEAKPPDAANSLGLDIIANDVGYFSTIKIGTPPREFKILMDSGSADFWVGAENCASTNGGGCGNHVFLGAQSSSSFVDSKQPFQVKYGTGAVAGTIVKDDLDIAGLQLKAHTFGIALRETPDFSDDDVPFDGLMGLAQSTLANQDTLTPVEALSAAGSIKQAITSYKISRLADQKNDGVITFGGLDTSKFDSKTLTTVPNLSRVGFWQAAMDSVTVNGQDLGFNSRQAILDTGTTLMMLPAADAAKLHQAIPGAKSDGQGGFIIPCTTNASVALSFGGSSFTIDPRDLVFAPLRINDPTGDCLSGISSGNIGGANEWLVGDVFLKSAYFSTDVEKNQISLAKLV